MFDLKMFVQESGERLHETWAPSLTRWLQYLEGSTPLRSLSWQVCDRTETVSASCQLPISAPIKPQTKVEALLAPEPSSDWRHI